MDQSAPKPKWSWKSILLSFVVIVVIFNLGFTLCYREGRRTLIRDATALQLLGKTNVVPQKIVDQ